MNSTPEETLFVETLRRPVSERAAFLEAACHGDPALRERLEALLAAHEQPVTVSDTRVADRPTNMRDLADESDKAVGRTLGPYKLLEQVGEGGYGVVYVAEQTEPVRRRVALKVIKLGMDSLHVAGAGRDERAGRGHALGWCGTRCPP